MPTTSSKGADGLGLPWDLAVPTSVSFTTTWSTSSSKPMATGPYATPAPPILSPSLLEPWSAPNPTSPSLALGTPTSWTCPIPTIPTGTDKPPMLACSSNATAMTTTDGFGCGSARMAAIITPWTWRTTNSRKAPLPWAKCSLQCWLTPRRCSTKLWKTMEAFPRSAASTCLGPHGPNLTPLGPGQASAYPTFPKV